MAQVHHILILEIRLSIVLIYDHWRFKNMTVFSKCLALLKTTNMLMKSPVTTFSKSP